MLLEWFWEEPHSQSTPGQKARSIAATVLGTFVRLGWDVDMLNVAAEGEIGCSMEAQKNPAGLDNVRAPGYDDQALLNEA